MKTDNTTLSLELARRLSETVNEAWESGRMAEQVTPVTRELLRFWFSEEFCSLRERNFHTGQRQAILNIIYLHEVLGVRNVLDYYRYVNPDIMPMADLSLLSQQKYQIPKYGVKMATGTGKTWVMHAILLWQMLNARHEETHSGRFTQNFLIVTPGLIVYDRMMDAFCGIADSEREERDIQTNDFWQNREVFIPTHYRQEVFAFIQNNVVTKDEGIDRKTTGDGLIALTNWHLFMNQIKEEEDDDDHDKSGIVGKLLPVRPGKTAGNDLSTLDRRAMRGSVLEYLASLDSIMVINDEAHHIHTQKKDGDEEDVVWQTGLVKTLLIDKRQELTVLEHLDYKAERDENGNVCGLSEGQRFMLRAGMAKLKKLEEEFVTLDKGKNPKMLIVCEDTQVAPFVTQFMTDDGLPPEDVITIDSNTKGDVTETEWAAIKEKLFNIDRYRQPKVIVSVLMLREGFDVNNICVIVPLRSSKSSILLEQIIGRGLRLMWREPAYQSTKQEDRKRVFMQHLQPTTYIDMLSIIEHPAFLKFYDDLHAQGIVVDDIGNIGEGGYTGDLIQVGLRHDYRQYDLEWPTIIKEEDEECMPIDININDLEPFRLFTLEKLRTLLAHDGETFISQEAISKTQFGQYKVTANLFNATSYNEYLQKLLRSVTTRFGNDGRRKGLPTLQIEDANIVRIIDSYIRTRLFDQQFSPFNGNDWKILLAQNAIVTQHIIAVMARAIYYAMDKHMRIDAQVTKIPFSSVCELMMREAYSLPCNKTIYERTNFPVHGGGLEKNFIKFLDTDGDVERFVKIDENQHPFATIFYIRTDGMMATYHPDFLVATSEKIYLIETKGNDKINDKNVRQKQRAAVEWVRKVNRLQPEYRMHRLWEYVLISESDFYPMSKNGAQLKDICDICKVSLSAITGDLFA